MNLDKRLEQMKEIKQYRIEKKFDSKKNHVYKVKLIDYDDTEKICVVKDYASNQEIFRKEAYLLSILKESGVQVPRIYHMGDHYLVMEYLEGDLLLELICQLEKGETICRNNIRVTQSYIIREICKWLKTFYQATRSIIGKEMIFGDTHLRNFIFTNQVYAVDFEDCCEGIKEADCGKLCAYILTYSPAFTEWKEKFVKEFMHSLVRELSIDGACMIDKIKKELANIGKRRNIIIPESIEDSLFI